MKTKQKPIAQSSWNRARLFLARSAACVAAACSIAVSRFAEAPPAAPAASEAPPPTAAAGDASKLSPKEPDDAILLAAKRHAELRAYGCCWLAGNNTNCRGCSLLHTGGLSA